MAARPKHPANLTHRAMEIVHVQQRHTRYDQIGAVISERQRGRVSEHTGKAWQDAAAARATVSDRSAPITR